jgi:hypothetical protein
MTPWRVASSLLVLLGEVNERWPERDKKATAQLATQRTQHRTLITTRS